MDTKFPRYQALKRAQDAGCPFPGTQRAGHPDCPATLKGIAPPFACNGPSVCPHRDPTPMERNVARIAALQRP